RPKTNCQKFNILVSQKYVLGDTICCSQALQLQLLLIFQSSSKVCLLVWSESLTKRQWSLRYYPAVMFQLNRYAALPVFWLVPLTYTAMEKVLKKTNDEQQYVSTTADIWTAKNRSFLGVTVHWIDSETLQRKKAAIACHRFRGRHSYDAIASELEDIFSQYGLTTEKVTACVTDNGSNFVKAFKEFQRVKTEDDEEEEVEEDDDGKLPFSDLHSILTEGDNEDAQQGLCVLPAHHRCAAQTLNLIASNVVHKWLVSNPESRTVYRSSTGSALCTKASRSTVAFECLEEISERKLIVASVTRWNSFYDVYVRIMEMPLTDINNLCIQIQIKCMKDREYQFLKECCSIMKPFCVALDILQGEKTCFYGTLQPTLEVLMAKTLAMQNGLSQMIIGLPKIIVGAIKIRFATTIDSKNALLAAVSLPKFKLRWVKEETRRDHIKHLLTTECRILTVEELATPMSDAAQPAAVISYEDDFFSFDEKPNAMADALMSVETEVTSYLNSDPVIESLHQFPRIKQIFLLEMSITEIFLWAFFSCITSFF
uniref:HAT C-terminal dimerisation domain-containing protein n=1 Tax=Cyprinodon variegatus TaxID=28743 RepID=A0A3Q2ECX1_CYPVA